MKTVLKSALVLLVAGMFCVSSGYAADADKVENAKPHKAHCHHGKKCLEKSSHAKKGHAKRHHAKKNKMKTAPKATPAPAPAPTPEASE